MSMQFTIDISMIVMSLLLFPTSDAVHKRDGITVVTYDEIFEIWQNDPDRSYLHKPFIITDSPMQHWTLVEELGNIFDPFEEVKVKKQTTDCACFADSPMQYELCKQFGSSFLYSKPFQNYQAWSKFEGRHTQSAKYMHCVNKEYDESMQISAMIDGIADKSTDKQFETQNNIHFSEFNTSDNYDMAYENNFENMKSLQGINPVTNELVMLSFAEQNSNPTYAYPNASNTVNIKELQSEITAHSERMENYTKLYSYFEIFQMSQSEQMLTALQLDFLDQIRLTPFFKIFSMRWFLDLNMHLWFGLEYYRAMRHYDKNDNLFFVLKGSRTFKLSEPTLNVFPLFPYNHASNRQQLPYYSLLQTNDERDGYTIPNGYTVHTVDISENEMLYLPGFWWHEVTNDNVTVALSMWWDCEDMLIERRIEDVKLPTNPNRDNGVSVYEMDGFLYFIQRFIERFCGVVEDHATLDRNISLRCLDREYKGYGFLTSNFRNIYRILDDLTYDNFEWMSIILDIGNIVTCAKDRIYDYTYDDMTQFKNDLYVCWDFEDKDKAQWDLAIDAIVGMLSEQTSAGISELVMQEYLENILFALSGDANILPIWIKTMQL